MFFSGKYLRQQTDKSEIIRSVFLQNIGFIVAKIPANVHYYMFRNWIMKIEVYFQLYIT